jgi:charged multivesicular body protein 4
MPLNFFKTKPTAPTPKQALSKLDETIELLEKREKFLQSKCEQQVFQAKEFMKKGNKKGNFQNQLTLSGALVCLKRKKAYEAEIEKLSNSKISLETQALGIQGAQVNISALEAMKYAAEATQELYKDL